jgi:hypothetical protein
MMGFQILELSSLNCDIMEVKCIVGKKEEKLGSRILRGTQKSIMPV